MRESDEFAYSSRMTKGVSFDELHFDAVTGIFTANANLPRSAAQQLVRARKTKLKQGIICVSAVPKMKNLHVPLS